MIGDQRDGHGLVSPSDIADLAGVSRGAVSNWRRRSAGFPEPVAGTPSKPLFSLKQVTEWLERHASRTRNEALLAPDRSAETEMELWAALNADRDRLSAFDASELVLALAVARKRDLPSADLPRVNAAAETVDRIAAALQRVSVDELGTVVDFVLARLARSQIKVGADFGFVGSRTTSLLANLARTVRGGVLYDPACGIGAALLESVSRGARADRIVGHDINDGALRIAAQRADLHNVAVELVRTDVLANDVDPALRADVVIAEPPFGMQFEVPDRFTDARFEFGTPPRMSADLAWIQHAIAHLSDTGRAYVLTASAPLFRSGGEAKIRAELVRRGCIEAVVGLPPKLLPHTSIPLAVWVLRRPPVDIPNGNILLIDASEEPAPEDRIEAWLTDRESLSDIPHVEPTLTEILAEGSVLTPQRWISDTTNDPEELRAAYRTAWAAIDAESSGLERALTGVERYPRLSTARVMTIRELVEQDVLDIRIGRPTQAYQDSPTELQERIVTARDVRDGHLPDAIEGTIDDHPDLSRPNDVFVSTMTVVRACVDSAGGHLPSTGVYRVRVRDQAALSPDYLATVLSGRWNERLQAGTTIQRASIKDLEVPVLPRSEQDQVVRTSQAIRRLERHAARLTDRARDADSALLDAVRHNSHLTRPGPSADIPQCTDLEPTGKAK